MLAAATSQPTQEAASLRRGAKTRSVSQLGNRNCQRRQRPGLALTGASAGIRHPRPACRERGDLDLHHNRHRPGAARGVAEVLPGSLPRRVPDRDQMDAALGTEALRHPAAGVRDTPGGGRLGVDRGPPRIGHGGLSQRVRLADGARHRQAAAGGARGHPVGRLRLPGRGRRLADREVSVPVGGAVQRAQRLRGRGDHDPADDRLAERRRAPLGAPVAAGSGLRTGGEQVRRDGRDRHPRRVLGRGGLVLVGDLAGDRRDDGGVSRSGKDPEDDAQPARERADDDLLHGAGEPG